jgi:hypothetical protein
VRHLIDLFVSQLEGKPQARRVSIKMADATSKRRGSMTEAASKPVESVKRKDSSTLMPTGRDKPIKSAEDLLNAIAPLTPDEEAQGMKMPNVIEADAVEIRAPKPHVIYCYQMH